MGESEQREQDGTGALAAVAALAGVDTGVLLRGWHFRD